MKKALKITAIVIASIFILAMLVVLGFKAFDGIKHFSFYKAAEKEYGGKPEKKHQKGNVDIEATKNNSKSLFHQDDEDYVPPVKDEEQAPEIKADDSGAISKAPLKEDRKHDKKDN